MSRRIYTEEQKKRRAESQRQRLATNAEARAKARANALSWARANKQRKAEYDKAKREAAPEVFSARYRAYYEKNKERRTLEIRASNVARKERIRRQKIAKEYSAEIREIYKSCPPGHHVDHIIPLRGDGVSGLHVPWNLQYLEAIENLKKGAKWGSL